jgi:hypothetical protein
LAQGADDQKRQQHQEGDLCMMDTKCISDKVDEKNESKEASLTEQWEKIEDSAQKSQFEIQIWNQSNETQGFSNHSALQSTTRQQEELVPLHHEDNERLDGLWGKKTETGSTMEKEKDHCDQDENVMKASEKANHHQGSYQFHFRLSIRAVRRIWKAQRESNGQDGEVSRLDTWHDNVSQALHNRQRGPHEQERRQCHQRTHYAQQSRHHEHLLDACKTRQLSTEWRS